MPDEVWWDIENAVDAACDLARMTGLRHKVWAQTGKDHFGAYRFVVAAIHPPEKVPA